MADLTQAEFEKKLAAEQDEGFKNRMQNEPPIGTGPDGTVVTYDSVEDIPPYEPEIIPDEDDDDLSDLDDLDELA
jgi:hypothetical protein